VSFAVIKEAAQSVSESNGYLHGYPPWLIVVIGAVIAAVVLWIFAKLVKWTIWVVILVVLVGGLVVAGRMLLGG
jgi:hypothetical protein